MKKWWGDIEFALDEVKTWRIGEREIRVQRKEKEWLVWDLRTKHESDDSLLLETTVEPEQAPLHRHLMNASESVLKIEPTLADRSMIVRPSSPLSVLPGESTELFVSTPLWLRAITYRKQSTIIDLPFWLPSDSWFGTSTMHGELCYAKYTDAKVQLANITPRSHRAITTVSIANEHHEPFIVQRINLPVNLLDTYVDDDQQFWTDCVVITHDESHKRASLDIKKRDTVSKDALFSKVSAARKVADSNIFSRSIKSLVG